MLLGNSSECPPPGNAEDDTVCLDLGKCKDGKCVPFCEREQQLESCACNGEHVSRHSLAVSAWPCPSLGALTVSYSLLLRMERAQPTGMCRWRVETDLWIPSGSFLLSVKNSPLASPLATCSDLVASVGRVGGGSVGDGGGGRVGIRHA